MIEFLIPFAILGGMDGVEPLRASAPPRETYKMSSPSAVRRTTELRGLDAWKKKPRGYGSGGQVMAKREQRCREASVREIARLTGYSPAHVCYTRRGLRISRPLRAKMRELGLKFREGK